MAADAIMKLDGSGAAARRIAAMADRLVKEKQQASRAKSVSPLSAYTVCRLQSAVTHAVDINI